MTYKKTPKNAQIFHCEKCDFRCSKQSDFNRHLSTAKHKILTNTYEKTPKNAASFTCECGKEYKHRQSLYAHKKKCEWNESEITENSNTSVVVANDNVSIIQEMKEMQRELLDTIQNQQETINNMVSKVGNTTNNLTNNNNFNINLFLNDKCKDAINFSDFIDRIEISHDDLENNRELGFVNGVTKILMDNLNTMNLYERPLHCTDTKRETLYIKEADEWKKEDGGVKLESAIQEVSRKSIRSLIDWKNENPDYEDLDSDFSKKCIEIQQQSCGSVNKKKTYPKIIQNIARNNTIKNNELN